MLVARGGVDLGAALDEQPGGLDVAEEAREPQRLEAVLRPGVRERRILVEQLSNPVGPADGGRFEDVELGIRSKQLLHSSLVPPVDGLEELGHLRPSSARARPARGA